MTNKYPNVVYPNYHSSYELFAEEVTDRYFPRESSLKKEKLGKCVEEALKCISHVISNNYSKNTIETIKTFPEMQLDQKDIFISSRPFHTKNSLIKLYKLSHVEQYSADIIKKETYIGSIPRDEASMINGITEAYINLLSIIIKDCLTEMADCNLKHIEEQERREKYNITPSAATSLEEGKRKTVRWAEQVYDSKETREQGKQS